KSVVGYSEYRYGRELVRHRCFSRRAFEAALQFDLEYHPIRPCDTARGCGNHAAVRISIRDRSVRAKKEQCNPFCDRHTVFSLLGRLISECPLLRSHLADSLRT